MTSDAVSQEEAQAIANAVIRARKRAGLTQTELAKAMGITQSTYARLESAATVPSVRTLQRVARATSSRIHLSIDPVSDHDLEHVRPTMTEKFTKPRFATDRRHFVGGALGLAGLLGTGAVRQVSAQEASDAATATPEYVWTPPVWGEERGIFTIIERNDETAIVETIEGQIEVPSTPQNLVTLSDEYVPLFELGYTDSIVAVGNSIPGFETLLNAGDLTDEMHSVYAEVPIVRTPSLDLDIEVLLGLQPDLILGGRLDEIYGSLSEVAPTLHRDFRITDVPRGGIRDLAALFGIEETATQVLADHEAYIARAREAAASAIEGKRVLVIEFWPDSNQLQLTPSYYLSDGNPAVISLGYPFFRELGFTPSSFVELIADAGNREEFFFAVSLEELGNIDADLVFVSADENLFGDFMAIPIVQSSVAFQNDAIYRYDREAYGFGLAGMRAAVKGIVETVTGETFE